MMVRILIYIVSTKSIQRVTVGQLELVIYILWAEYRDQMSAAKNCVDVNNTWAPGSRLDNPHTGVLVRRISNAIVPIDEGARVLNVLKSKWEEEANMPSIQTSHAFQLMVGTDQYRIVSRWAAPPRWQRANALATHASNTAQITRGKECRYCRVIDRCFCGMRVYVRKLGAWNIIDGSIAVMMRDLVIEKLLKKEGKSRTIEALGYCDGCFLRDCSDLRWVAISLKLIQRQLTNIFGQHNICYNSRPLYVEIILVILILSSSPRRTFPTVFNIGIFSVLILFSVACGWSILKVTCIEAMSAWLWVCRDQSYLLICARTSVKQSPCSILLCVKWAREAKSLSRHWLVSSICCMAL